MWKDDSDKLKKQLELSEIILREYIILGPTEDDDYNYLYTVLSKLQFYDDGIMEVRPISNTQKIAVVASFSATYTEIERVVKNLRGKVIEQRMVKAVIVDCSEYNYSKKYERMFIDTNKPDLIARRKSELSLFLTETILSEID